MRICLECAYRSLRTEMLRDWTNSEPLVLVEDEFGKVDKFSYLASWISLDGRTSDEVFWCVQKVWLASTNMKHLWRRGGVRSLFSGCVNSSKLGLAIVFGNAAVVNRCGQTFGV